MANRTPLPTMTFRERRLAGGWTLETIAAIAEVNISTLHRIETGRTNPNRTTVRAINAALAIKENKQKEAVS